MGVDLYDGNYFYQDKARDYDISMSHSAKDKHKTSKPVLEIISKWKDFLQAEGVSLYVYNEKSLLKSVIPIFLINDIIITVLRLGAEKYL